MQKMSWFLNLFIVFINLKTFLIKLQSKIYAENTPIDV